MASASVLAQTVGVATVAGQAGSAAFTNATGTSARFSLPAGLASDGTTIYIADQSNNAIRKLLISTGEVTTMATGFSSPGAVAVDGSGNAFVADSSNHVIKKVTSGGTVTVQAGASGTSGASVASATMANARFNSPQGVAVNSAGTIVYVADTGNNVVRRIDIGGDAVTEIATGFKPWGLALNAAGTMLYVADFSGHTIRSIAVSAGNTLATVAGTSGTFGSTDSPALFRFPQALAVDSAGDLYVADTGNHTIRKIVGSTVTTIAGQAGSIGSTDALGTSARFQGPAGIVATAVNSLYIADTSNHTIRRALPATAPAFTSANNTSFTVGVAGTFTVTASGSPAPTFSVISGSLPTGITLNSTTGVISGTATSGSGSPVTFTIQASNGVSPAATQVFTLTLTQAPTITSANTTTFAVNTTGSFTVTASGSPAPTFGYTGSFPPWASLNTTTGVISGTPLSNSGSPFVFTISASNGIGTAATQVFTLNVNTGAGIGTHPSDQTALIGATATFTVVATGTPAPTYQWERQPAGGFSYSPLSEGGNYLGTTTATLFVTNVSSTMNGDRFRVVVNNGIGSAVTSNSAQLTAAQVPAITSTAAATFVVNQAGSFTVTATGSPAPTFSYSGTFPPWASLNTTTGVISGTPTSVAGSPFTFTLTASNGISPAATQNFVLTVSLADAGAAISTQPVAATVQLGQSATFTAAATGTPTPTLRWQRQPAGTTGYVDLSDDASYSGTTTGTLTVINPAAGMSGDHFRLVATNTVNSIAVTAASDGALLTVNIGTAITTFAGTSGTSGTLDGTGTAARFNTPASIAVDLSGNFYVADAANNVIRKITSGGVVTTLAGQPGASGNSDGDGTAARFNGPSGVAVDVIGNVYVADTYNHTIRVVTPTGSVSTLVGLANNSGSADGTGSAARFSFPAGITVDSSGTLYISDSSNHTIRRVTVGGVVTTLAGSAGSSGSSDGFGSAARFAYPNGIVVTSSYLYVADSFNHTIRRITLAGDVSTVAGGAGQSGSTDANGTLARFNQPIGISADSAGNLYVADTFNNTIRKITTAGDVTTLAGTTGVSGTADGVGSEARFNQPFSLTVTSGGNVYIADTRNHSIRRSGTTTAPGIQTQPQNRTVPAGGTTTFAVVATGVPQPSYQWQRQPSGTSGFGNLTNDSFYSGVTTATLTLNNVLSTANGDQFRVVVSNGITPSATSDAASLTIGEAPVITSAATATFRATEAGTFTVTASGSPTPTYSGNGFPSWLTINPQTGVLSGTPPESAVGQVGVQILATNGSTATQIFTLVVTPALVAPTIQTQPAGVAVNPGQSATFSVTAQGTAPLSYQWLKNGGAINGATGSTLTIANAQLASAGTYSVRITNNAGSITSNGVALVVNSVPVFAAQPRSQVVLAGGTVTFNVTATGGNVFTYQWRRNGVAILGANNASLTISGVTAAEAGLYDVVVTSAVGPAVSSVAELTVVSAPVAPVITAQPSSRTVIAGATTTLSVVATGVPAPTYQWRRNGLDLPGAVGPSYTLASATPGNAGVYQVVVSNGLGTVTSAPAVLNVAARSYAGYYFGSFSGGAGNFALYVRDDNTGVFLGYLPGVTAPVLALALTVNDAGTFTFNQGAVTTNSDDGGAPARAAALAPVVVTGTIGSDGNVSGNVIGGASLTFSAARIADGATAGLAGFYQAGSGTNGTTVNVIVSPNGQSFAVAQSGVVADGGLGVTSSTGTVSVASARTTFTGIVSSGSGSLNGSLAGAITGTVTGGSDGVLARQRLVNISSRARVAGGDAVAIAGFVISGEESKPVLIRAVGPTLGAAPFNVPGVLAAPRLELFRGATSLAVNAGIAGNRAVIDAASAQAGAFALGAAGADAAIVTTLAPGNYTAVVSSANNAAGVALVEVYDLSAVNPGQKLLNIATRAPAGANENTLIAGFVIPPGSSKRVLIRGVGPGLTPFGVTGLLAQPVLSLLSGSTTVAQNTNWNSSPDAALITSSSAQVGAFGLANNDSALIATLAPGNYTAQVTGVGGATGVALIEVYELP